jgi:predicted phage terminase large subunit-like protein
MLKRLQADLAPAPDQRTDHNAALPFTDFKRRFWKSYIHMRHHAPLDALMEQVARYVFTGGAEGIGRAMIFMPPRHGKTKTVSHLFPAWLLSQNPDVRLIAASYGATLAHRNSRFVRNLVASREYQTAYPETRLSRDTASVNEWDIAGRDGGLIAAGVGGGVTGHGAKLIIIDDVVKSRAEAESATYRQRVKDWYDNDLLTRLEEPGGAIILMMTRWHTDDLAGYLLDSDEGWHVLSLPAIAGSDDLLGRAPGEALWADRYTVEILANRRARMGEYAFSSLYQQTPLPPGGRLFDTGKIEIIDYTPDCQHTVRFYDLAVTARKHSDYTVGLKLGLREDQTLIVLDVYRVQKIMPDVERDIVQNAAIDGRSTRIRFEAEKAGIVQLDYLLRNPAMHGYVMDATPPEGDKFTRAQPAATRINNGMVKMVRGAWNRAFLDELSVFPSAEHDDQVDALSGAYDMLINGQPTWDLILA